MSMSVRARRRTADEHDLLEDQDDIDELPYVHKSEHPVGSSEAIEHEGKLPAIRKLIPTKGSIGGSVFNLASATLGAGTLALPYTVAVSGLLLAICQLLVAPLLTIYSVRLLIRASEITTLKSYEELARYCFGKKAELFAGLNIFMFAYGVAVAYIVALGDLIEPLGKAAFGPGSFFSERPVLMTMAVVTLMLPLAMLKDISSLQFASMLGVFSVFFLVFSVFIQSLRIIYANGIASDVSWIINSTHGQEFMLGVPIMMFAFTNQINIFAIYTELQRPSCRRMIKVNNLSTLICLVVFSMIGISAYLAFGSSLAKNGNILLSFPEDDPIMALCRAAIAFTVAVAFPLDILPCRFTIETLFFKSAKESLVRHVLLTMALVFVALLLAIFCPGINVAFGVIGGTCSTLVCFCFPAAFILKLEEGSLFGRKKIGSLILLVVAIILGSVGTVITVTSSVNPA